MNSTGDEESLRKCPHLPCQCMIYPEQEYCSNYCSTAGDAESTEIKCNCGQHDCALKGASRGRKAPSVFRRRMAVNQKGSTKAFP